MTAAMPNSIRKRGRVHGIGAITILVVVCLFCSFHPRFATAFVPRNSKSCASTTALQMIQTNDNELESMDFLRDLVTASSLSYLSSEPQPNGNGEATTSKMQASPYFTGNLKPLAQVIDPKTESGATLFEYHQESNSGKRPTLVVACRGSATPINFSTNLRFQLVPLLLLDTDEEKKDRYLVHNGFQEASTGLWKLLKKSLDELVDNQTYSSIVFTGHSLGAANALLCAIQYEASTTKSPNLPTLTKVITFGGPRLVNIPLADHWNSKLSSCRVQNFVHDQDPILRQNGPLWDSLGFGIVGDEIPCEAFRAKAYREPTELEEYNARDLPLAWNILDHCHYLGIFVGPRLV